jgi:hypothetical protein
LCTSPGSGARSRTPAFIISTIYTPFHAGLSFHPGRRAADGENEEYLRKLIKLSKDHGIKLLLVTIPYRRMKRKRGGPIPSLASPRRRAWRTSII